MSCDHELADEWWCCSGKNISYITRVLIAPSPSLRLLLDLLFHIFGLKDQESCAKINRVIIAGNSLSQCTQSKDSETKVL